jgi:subtilase family serine protease
MMMKHITFYSSFYKYLSSFINNKNLSMGGWGWESTLDVQAVHGMAPGASILLVLCNSATDSDLSTSLKYASLHAGIISPSLFSFLLLPLSLPLSLLLSV